MKVRARTGAAVLAALLLGSGGALASCNLIVGAGDYVVVDAGNDATSSGNGGGGDAGASVGCGQSLPVGQSDFQNLVDTCVLAVSCDPLFFNVNVSACISLDFPQSSASLACLSTIQDCTGYYQCAGLRYATATECPDGGAPVACDTANNVAIDCNRGLAFNCTKSGGTCGTYTDPSGAAGVDCIVVPSCMVSDGGFECAQNKSYSCIGGVGYGLDCTTVKATCSGTECLYNAPICTKTATVTCNGDLLNECTSSNYSYDYKCARSGLTCTIDDGGLGNCSDPACSAATTNCTESCDVDGHTMRVCVGGAPFAIDCAQHAPFTKCTTATRKSNSVVYAFCK
jgi:hypothetical protein